MSSQENQPQNVTRVTESDILTSEFSISQLKFAWRVMSSYVRTTWRSV